MYGFRAGGREVNGEECGRIEANFFERLEIKLDSSFGKETLANHPTKWDSGQAVPCVILDRSSTNVYKTISGLGMLRREKEKITTMTPSKPNFLHVSLSESLVVLLVGLGLHFTLVMLMRKPSVKVRVALI
jgi:hypothetical protein